MKSFAPKIALINVTKDDWGYLEPPLGVLSIANYVIHKGLISRKNLILLDVVLRDPVSLLKYFKPDLVGISSFTSTYPDAIKLGKKIKEIFDIPVVVGGVHISACPDQLDFPFDIGVVGEGEETFAELVELFSKDGEFMENKLRRIKGLALRNVEGGLELTGSRASIAPLDKIPPFDWSLLPKTYFRPDLFKVDGQWRALKLGTIFSARGCPFKCIFCARHSVFGGVRFFSTSRTADEIENLVKNYGVEAIHIYDDTFTISKDRVSKLILELKKRRLLGKVVFPKVFGRADLVDEEFLQLLKDLGVISVVYGFESGSERILKYLKNETVKVGDNVRAIDLTDKYGLGIIGGFMFASPNETKADMKKTLDLIRYLAKKDGVIKLSITRTTPFPGTKLWQYAADRGIVSDKIDWTSTELFFRNIKVPPPFFTEKISPEDYKKIWLEANKICFQIGEKIENQKKASGVVDRLQKVTFFNQVTIPIQLISREFGNGRYALGIRWFLDKARQHLFTPAKLQVDLLRLKALFVLK